MQKDTFIINEFFRFVYNDTGGKQREIQLNFIKVKNHLSGLYSDFILLDLSNQLIEIYKVDESNPLKIV